MRQIINFINSILMTLVVWIALIVSCVLALALKIAEVFE